MVIKIIDVSKHNGNIDFDMVAKDPNNIAGVIIRAGFGKLASQKDIRFEENYKKAKAANLHVGAYWYSYAHTPDEAIQEAKAFLECIKGKQFDLPVYFDIEEKLHVKLSKKMCTDIVEAFCMAMEKAGYFCGVYSFDSFFATNLESPRIPTRYSCWIARVDGKAPQSCSSYGMWQYSWKATINGIENNVDINDCYKDFPGIIVAAGLNGYNNNKKADTYTVEAKINGCTTEKAEKISTDCKGLGMTVKQVKE